MPKVNRPADYWDKKFPGRTWKDGKLVFFWQSAFPDAFNHHYVIPGDTWDALHAYDVRCSSSLKKEYYSADRAITDLLYAIGVNTCQK